MFSPFHRAWQLEPRREVLQAPRSVVLPDGIDPGELPSLEELGLEQEVDHPMRGGETEGRKLLGGRPRLSPYLHFGCVSAREAEERAPDDDYRRRLAWRDFYHQVLLHHPENAHQEFQERYRGSLGWEDDEEALEAWKDGRTGFPLVDAGMRQLKREGWMPNRIRLVVASFLTKQLGVDWREGERHFMRLLLDGDEANNNGNWQWITSVGVDPAPYFRRLYNPTRQMETHDPDGSYVREHVPELRDVPHEYLREPWTMPGAAKLDYPEPIVDLREARERAVTRYRAAAGSAA
jgi:deoxyribodipyrimidine photo-lyase